VLTQFKGKKILITGHTGFKGSWLALWLTHLGARVVGMSLNIPSTPSNFIASSIENTIKDHRIDVRDAEAVRLLIHECQPDYIFHLAAQPLVRYSYEIPLETITANAIGPANVLDALRTLKKPVVVVMITSDKAYDNVEWVWGYRETDRLGGKDPYSGSKGMAELAIRTYVESYFKAPGSNVRVGIGRAGNVIGGGDWAVDRIMPDCIRAWSANKTVDIRSPKAIRPWQHVLEPLSGYLALAVALSNARKHGEAYNFGPTANQNYSVSELLDETIKYWDNVRWNDVSQSRLHLHEADLLKLNCDKALFDLNWRPTLKFEETVRMTVEWYKLFYENDTGTMYDFSIAQIEEYTQLAKSRGIEWAASS
jgi:CDP-glucose 4,6-dehydratase